MAERHIKRARLNPGARRDTLPLPDDDRSLPVQSIEAKITRVGGTVRQGLIVRTAIEVPSSTWANLQQWEPVDNPTYALDPGNGEMYEATLAQNVMDVPLPPVIQPKKKYKRSKVSVRSDLLIHLQVELTPIYRSDPMLYGRMSTVRGILRSSCDGKAAGISPQSNVPIARHAESILQVVLHIGARNASCPILYASHAA